MKEKDKNHKEEVKKIKELETKLEEVKEKCDLLGTQNTELQNNWKRALADYQNLQKRTAEERAGFIEFSNTALIKRFLPVLDNLELMEKHTNDTGIKLIAKEFSQILNEEGLKEIMAEGENFDPSIMEALDTIEGEDNKVMEVIQKGYFLREKLFRPARVKVGKRKK